ESAIRASPSPSSTTRAVSASTRPRSSPTARSARRPAMPADPALRLHSDTSPAPKDEAVSAAVEPLLVDTDHAAVLCGISCASWYRLRSAGKIGPLEVRLGGRVLYRIEE